MVLELRWRHARHGVAWNVLPTLCRQSVEQPEPKWPRTRTADEEEEEEEEEDEGEEEEDEEED